ncbi:hypothetical protein [Streptomyces sp. KL116D]|uniref:hypothetical protein n=1 Tax=Streptomyces sp. KL116D TaxID=3045152 RepID=UPI003556A2CB
MTGEFTIDYAPPAWSHAERGEHGRHARACPPPRHRPCHPGRLRPGSGTRSGTGARAPAAPEADSGSGSGSGDLESGATTMKFSAAALKREFAELKRAGRGVATAPATPPPVPRPRRLAPVAGTDAGATADGPSPRSWTDVHGT